MTEIFVELPGEAKTQEPEHRSADFRIGHAARWAALELLYDADATADALAPMRNFEEPFARFVRAAGDVPGESLYRWSAARNMHPLPADGYAKVSPQVRLFFEAFVAVVKALAPIVDPPKTEKRFVHAPQNHVDPEDTIFRRYGAADERTHGRVAPGTAATTDGLAITPFAPAPGAAPAAAGQAASGFRPMVIAGQTLEDFGAGRMPTAEEFAALTPEQRRPYAALMGMPGIEAVMNEQAQPAPEAEGLEPLEVSGVVENAAARTDQSQPPTVAIAGTLAVGKTRGARK